MRYYFDSGPKDQMLFKEFLFLAIVAILFSCGEPLEQFW